MSPGGHHRTPSGSMPASMPGVNSGYLGMGMGGMHTAQAYGMGTPRIMQVIFFFFFSPVVVTIAINHQDRVLLSGPICCRQIRSKIYLFSGERSSKSKRRVPQSFPTPAGLPILR